MPKVLHKVGGKAMVERVLETVQSLGTDKMLLSSALVVMRYKTI